MDGDLTVDQILISLRDEFLVSPRPDYTPTIDTGDAPQKLKMGFCDNPKCTAGSLYMMKKGKPNRRMVTRNQRLKRCKKCKKELSFSADYVKAYTKDVARAEEEQRKAREALKNVPEHEPIKLMDAFLFGNRKIKRKDDF